MQYTGNFEQKRALIEALRLLHIKGVSDGVLAHAIDQDLKQGKIRGFPPETSAALSRATIQRYREKYSPETSQMKRSSAGLMYNFLRQSQVFETPLLASKAITDTSHELSSLIGQFLHHFGARKGLFDDDDLASLEGTFHAYRKAWTSLKKNTYIRSVVEFKRYGSSLIYTDTQEYYDPVVEHKASESDTGFVIPFNLSVVMIGKGISQPLLKFGALHGFSPLPDGNVPVLEFTGNFTIVYNKWQHLSFPVLARRVEPELASSQFYNEGEIDKGIEQELSAVFKKYTEHLFPQK